MRADFQRRFTHYFIDEVQDTDPLQAEILLLLAADDAKEHDWRKVRTDPGKLFFVGDPKQSLYRFRRADIAIYQDLKDRLIATGAVLLHLTTSFRAPPSIQALVNGAFAPAMAAAAPGTQADYVALTPARSEPVGQPTIIALPVPRPYSDSGNITNGSIEASLPDAVAAFVEWLVEESGWTVEERQQRVAVRPRHVAILFRRFQSFGADITRPYVRALEARRVPHVLVGGRSFHDREEVAALRNALVAIEWPDDELRVFATLRGPFVALDDSALLSYRQHVNDDGNARTHRLDPTRPADRALLPIEAAPVADALDLLRHLHRGRNHRPISQTVAMFLEEVRAHAGVALWPNGEQALANCQRMIDMARAFESRALSFRAFVEELEEGSAGGETAEAPIVEEGTEGVRIMTVHKAKGLEFPVVILADPTCSAARDKPSRHVVPDRQLWLETLCGCAPIELLEAADEEVERERAEGVRVAYVAATRAQDLIVLPACGDRPIPGWLEALSPLIYPSSTIAGVIRQVAGCPRFEGDTVVDRGPNGMTSAEAVLPGLHRPQIEGPDVVWWSPSALRLDVPVQAPLRQQQILEIDPDGASAVSQATYEEWRSSHEATIQKASQAYVSFSTVTSSARVPSNERVLLATGQSEGGVQIAEPNISFLHIARSGTKAPSGRRFGTLVHAILAVISLDADQSVVAAMSELHGRVVGATRHEIAAAARTVVTTLNHSIFQRAKQAAIDGFLRREVPVVTRAGDGSLVEGIIDLAFRESTADGVVWTVVDFKTDRDPTKAEAIYERQVSLYCRAVTASTGLPCEGHVLAL